MPRLRHYDNLGSARFVTFSCYRRMKNFRRRETFKLFIKHLELAREKYEFRLYGYVLMPDHVHLILHPAPDCKLGLIIREIKSKMAREYFAGMLSIPTDAKRVFWQTRCYDHNCRTPETVIEKINYCHNNPVVRGLVRSPGDWPWSSYNWYQGRENIPIVMDEMES